MTELLALRWGDVSVTSTNEIADFVEIARKSGRRRIELGARKLLGDYRRIASEKGTYFPTYDSSPIFLSRQYEVLTRMQAWRIVHQADRHM